MTKAENELHDLFPTKHHVVHSYQSQNTAVSMQGSGSRHTPAEEKLDTFGAVHQEEHAPATSINTLGQQSIVKIDNKTAVKPTSICSLDDEQLNSAEQILSFTEGNRSLSERQIKQVKQSAQRGQTAAEPTAALQPMPSFSRELQNVNTLHERDGQFTHSTGRTTYELDMETTPLDVPPRTDQQSKPRRVYSREYLVQFASKAPLVHACVTQPAISDSEESESTSSDADGITEHSTSTFKPGPDSQMNYQTVLPDVEHNIKAAAEARDMDIKDIALHDKSETEASESEASSVDQFASRKQTRKFTESFTYWCQCSI